MEKLLVSFPEHQDQAWVELNSFLAYIDKKIGKIQNYVNSTDRSEPKTHIANTGSFIFSFTINPDKSSKVEISLIKKVSRDFEPSFLSDRVRQQSGHVYFLYSEHGYKIGCTKDINARINAFGVKLPFKTSLYASIKVDDYSGLESFFHKLLSHKRTNGEWFNLVADDFEHIKTVCKNMGLEISFYG